MGRSSVARVVMLLAVAPFARAGTEVDWTLSPVDGRWYAITPAGTWDSVREVAVNWGADLAVVESAEAQAWTLAYAQASLPQPGDVWIGLYQDLAAPSYNEPAGGWAWVDGTPLVYANWSTNEPNNVLPGEHFAEMSVVGGTWNDNFAMKVEPGLASLASDDCDGDLIPDLYEVAAGLEDDANGDGVLDKCEPPPQVWTDLGGALAGINGEPLLAGTGTLNAGEAVVFSLSNVSPFAPSTLVIGVVNLSAPFKGGVMVPKPDILFGLIADGFGNLTFGGPWPASIPSGITTYYQYWIVDAGGPKGLAASNAISGTTP